jgi:predicted lipoprotein with Yx(FWY)xxD motif
VASVSGVGRVLVDSQGRTLYLFTPDKQSTPTCSGACASAWPPLMANGTPTAGSGATASMVGIVQGPSGTQVTYDHWPLYTFAGDSGPGQAKGQGLDTFGGHWSALQADGSMATTAAAPASSTTKPSSGGYGY